MRYIEFLLEISKRTVSFYLYVAGCTAHHLFLVHVLCNHVHTITVLHSLSFCLTDACTTCTCTWIEYFCALNSHVAYALCRIYHLRCLHGCDSRITDVCTKLSNSCKHNNLQLKMSTKKLVQVYNACLTSCACRSWVGLFVCFQLDLPFIDDSDNSDKETWRHSTRGVLLTVDGY